MKALLELRTKNYQLKNMTLAIISEKPLEVIKELVDDVFHVKRASIADECAPVRAIMKIEAFPFFIPLGDKSKKVETLEWPVTSYMNMGTEKLEIVWALKSLFRHWKSRPIKVLKTALHRNSKNDLVFKLLQKDLIRDFCTSFLENNAGFALFVVTFVLTDNGIKNWKEILEITKNFLLSFSKTNDVILELFYRRIQQQLEKKMDRYSIKNNEKMASKYAKNLF